MKHLLCKLPVCMLALLWVMSAQAEESAPWGKAGLMGTDYAPHKVVYDVAAADVASFSHVLDRVSFLNNIYEADPFDASIVLVLHGDVIPFFAIEKFTVYKELMTRAQSLTLAGNIEFRMCRVAAKGHGLAPEQIHGFVKMVPMADAELVRLQREEGYAYMR